MKFDFSIEGSIEKIQNRNTREYFGEVYQTFTNGNYRSATVMLYSVLICDLVYKLRDLRDIYKDKNAEKILLDVEKMQAGNPKSAEWESKLIEAVKVRTSLLEPSDHIAIDTLQKTRHLSAHPVLNNSDLLYSPNRDTIQALIRNILEGVLTNPPFFSSKIFNTILDDLSEVKGVIRSSEDLSRYLHHRYLSKLKINDFRKLVRSMWKMVFIADDDDARANGHINYNALKIFIASDKTACMELVKGEHEFYSKITKDENIELLIHFLSTFPEFFQVLSEPLKILIRQRLNNGGDIQFLGWFINHDIIDHLQKMKDAEICKISESAFADMFELAQANNCEHELFDFGIHFFCSSSTFDEAKHRFWNIIAPFEGHFTRKHILQLLRGSNKNSQIYRCFGMPKRITDIAERLNSEIDTSKYNQLYDI